MASGNQDLRFEFSARGQETVIRAIGLLGSSMQQSAAAAAGFRSQMESLIASMNRQRRVAAETSKRTRDILKQFAQFRRIGAGAIRFIKAMTVDLLGLTAAARTAAAAMGNLFRGGIVGGAARLGAAPFKALRRFGGAISALNRQLTIAVVGFNNFLSLSRRLANGINTVFIRPFQELLKVVVDTGDEFKRFSTILQGALGSASRAKEVAELTVELARTSPFTQQEVEQAVKSFAVLPQIAQKLQQTDFSKVRSDLEGLLETIQGLGLLNPFGVQGALVAFREGLGGNIQSFRRRIDVPVNILASISGVKESDIRKGGEPFVKAVTNFVNSTLGPRTIKELANTFDVQKNNLIIAVRNVFRQVGKAGIYDTLVDSFKLVAGEVDRLARGPEFQKVAQSLSDTLTKGIATGLAVVQVGSGRLSEAAGTDLVDQFQENPVVATLEAMKLLLEFLADTFVKLAAFLIEVLGAILKFVRENLPQITAGIKTVADIIATTVKVTVDLLKLIYDSLRALGSVITIAFLKLEDILVPDAVGGTRQALLPALISEEERKLGDIRDEIAADVNQLGNDLVVGFASIVTNLSVVTDRFIDVGAVLGSIPFIGAKAQIRIIPDKLREVFDEIKETAKFAGSPLTDQQLTEIQENLIRLGTVFQGLPGGQEATQFKQLLDQYSDAGLRDFGVPNREIQRARDFAATDQFAAFQEGRLLKGGIVPFTKEAEVASSEFDKIVEDILSARDKLFDGFIINQREKKAVEETFVALEQASNVAGVRSALKALNSSRASLQEFSEDLTRIRRGVVDEFESSFTTLEGGFGKIEESIKRIQKSTEEFKPPSELLLGTFSDRIKEFAKKFEVDVKELSLEDKIQASIEGTRKTDRNRRFARSILEQYPGLGTIDVEEIIKEQKAAFELAQKTIPSALEDLARQRTEGNAILVEKILAGVSGLTPDAISSGYQQLFASFVTGLSDSGVANAFGEAQRRIGEGIQVLSSIGSNVPDQLAQTLITGAVEDAKNNVLKDVLGKAFLGGETSLDTALLSAVRDLPRQKSADLVVEILRPLNDAVDALRSTGIPGLEILADKLAALVGQEGGKVFSVAIGETTRAVSELNKEADAFLQFSIDLQSLTNPFLLDEDVLEQQIEVLRTRQSLLSSTLEAAKKARDALPDGTAGRTQADRDVEELSRQLQGTNRELILRIADRQSYTFAQEFGASLRSSLESTIPSAFTETLWSIARDAESAAEAFEGLGIKIGETIINSLIESLVNQFITKNVLSLLGNLFGGGLPAFGGTAPVQAGVSNFGSAAFQGVGNLFQLGGVVGAQKGRLVGNGRPALAVVGEGSGLEAIIPLRSGAIPGRISASGQVLANLPGGQEIPVAISGAKPLGGTQGQMGSPMQFPSFPQQPAPEVKVINVLDPAEVIRRGAAKDPGSILNPVIGDVERRGPLRRTINKRNRRS